MKQQCRSAYLRRKINLLCALLVAMAGIFLTRSARGQVNLCRADTEISFAVKTAIPERVQKRLPHFQREYQKVIMALNDSLPSSVVTPENLKLSIVDRDGFSELKWLNEDTVEVRLALPQNFAELNQSDFTRMALAMALHEYGHAILEGTFARRSEIFRKNIGLLRNRDAVPKDALNTALVDTLFEKAYEELFADLLAVLYTDNVEAVPEVLEASGGSKEDALVRSFTSQHKLDGWEYRGPYGLLSPTRSFLGPKVVASRTSDEKARLVVSVLNAALPSIDQERGLLLKKLRPSMQYDGLDLDPERVNRRFIKHLQQYLK